MANLTGKLTTSLDAGAVLIEKSITSNGEYNASSDAADGYSKVTVDVAQSSYSRDVLFANTGTSVSEITNLAHPVTDYDEIEFIIGTTQSGAQMAYTFDATDFVTRFPYVADTTGGNFPFFAPSLFNGNYMMKIIMGETASEIKCFTHVNEYFVEIAGIKY